ncbi:hypothetical protein LRAMOSA05352 [Lichtheimia ramosa]|uniref:Uncharacterized protein n=1 Tax=Lichtheimia ramosa TaxID=688394 RepID=A0A077X104_9FUNG|nr:hypothetical protein LRAMOSA05352 [Lichtheimia ramosa]
MAFRFASIARRAFTRNYTSANSQQAGKAFREENFDSNIWRNTALAVIAGVAWYRIDQHVTELGEEKHPFTKWIEYHMSTSAEKDQQNTEALEKASQLAEYKLISQDAQRAPIYRMRYPESFERASPRGLVTGQQADLSDITIRRD